MYEGFSNGAIDGIIDANSDGSDVGSSDVDGTKFPLSYFDLSKYLHQEPYSMNID